MIDKVIAEALAREALADAPRGAGRRKMPRTSGRSMA